MAWWREWFPKRSLEGIRRRTHVRVRGIIGDGPTVQSPATDRRSAVIGWFLSKRYRPFSGAPGAILRTTSSQRNMPEEMFTPPRAAGVVRAGWLFFEADGQRVRLGMHPMRVRLASADWDGEFLPDHPRLSALPAIRREADMVYGERWLAAGDSAILVAEVQPVSSVGVSYRDGAENAPPAQLEVVSPFQLSDTIGQEFVVDHPGDS